MSFITIGSRIPYEYFITQGKGESDAGSKGLPFETGSYDAALTDAGIQNANIVKYTSVIPTGAKLLQKSKGLATIAWGEALECIMAQQNGKKGETISAGVMTTNVYDKKKKFLGGFAVEYAGSLSKNEVEKSLLQSIKGLIKRRNYGNLPDDAKLYQDNKTDQGFIIHPGFHFAFDIMTVKKHSGTVLASLCFVSFKIPILSSKTNKGGKKTRKKKKY